MFWFYSSIFAPISVDIGQVFFLLANIGYHSWPERFKANGTWKMDLLASEWCHGTSVDSFRSELIKFQKRICFPCKELEINTKLVISGKQLYRIFLIKAQSVEVVPPLGSLEFWFAVGEQRRILETFLCGATWHKKKWRCSVIIFKIVCFNSHSHYRSNRDYLVNVVSSIFSHIQFLSISYISQVFTGFLSE